MEKNRNTEKHRCFSCEEEVIDDYYVSKKKKKIWRIELDIAEEVKRICEKYNIKYFIIWGTLLGAVRHGGYIPWDDDFDIGFMRNDYIKFCEAAKKEIKYPYFVQDALTDQQFFMGYTRIRHSESTAWIFCNTDPNYNNGIYVDIYVFDVLVNNQLLRKLQFDTINWLISKAEKYNRNPKTICERLYNFVVPYKYIIKLYQKTCAFFNFITNAKYIGPVYSPVEIEQGYYFEKKDIEKTLKLVFEDTSFQAPRGYKNILKNVYGNYMKFPPREKRGTWHEEQVFFEPDLPYKEFYNMYYARNK